MGQTVGGWAAVVDGLGGGLQVAFGQDRPPEGWVLFMGVGLEGG